MIEESKHLNTKKIADEYQQRGSNSPNTFYIILDDGGNAIRAQRLSKRNEINEKTRLYYELGYKKNMKLGISESNWVRTGRYKEITSPVKFRDENDDLDDYEYIAHHNFFLKRMD